MLETWKSFMLFVCYKESGPLKNLHFVCTGHPMHAMSKITNLAWHTVHYYWSYRMRNFFQHFEFAFDNIRTGRGHENYHWESKNLNFAEDFFWVPYIHEQQALDVSYTGFSRYTYDPSFWPRILHLQIKRKSIHDYKIGVFDYFANMNNQIYR